MSHRESTKNALAKYLAKHCSTKTKRKNQRPEKIVEKEVVAWCESQGWFVNVIESKAVFSKSAGRYLRGSAKKGHVDISGTTDTGVYVAIELKAPGRLSTLRHEQRAFLTDSIHRFAFACVVDSSNKLAEIYRHYLSLNQQDRKNYLLSQLPPEKKEADDGPLFSD